MKKILLILPLIACACSARTGNLNLKDSESGISGQMAGLKTKPQVRKTLGAPNLSFSRDGLETYEYKTISGGGRLQWLIPVFGYFMSFWQDDYSYEETNLFVRFDKNDNVKDWNVIQTGGTSD